MIFSCINSCRVPRTLFEHEAVRPSVQTRPKNITEMISQCRNASPLNVMQTNQGPAQALSRKKHVQSARESHDLNMDFFRLQTASRYESPCKNIRVMRVKRHKSYFHGHCSYFSNIFLYAVSSLHWSYIAPTSCTLVTKSKNKAKDINSINEVSLNRICCEKLFEAIVQ